jgi:hypothetical protein
MNTNKVNVDWEFGKDTLRTLGSLRPFVGGVFGLVTYFGLQSGLVSLQIGDGGGDKGTENFYFYVFSFVAGFSERFAQDMLLASTMGAGGKKEDEAPPPVESQLPPVTATGQTSVEAPGGPPPAA